MYKIIAFNIGILLSIMLLINGMLASVTGIYFSNLIFHIVGFIFILIVAFVSKNKMVKLRDIPLIFFYPGISSVLVVVLNNITIKELGITLTIGISLLGQLIVSNLIDHFGLFDMPVNKFKKEKTVGFSIILLGILSMMYL